MVFGHVHEAVVVQHVDGRHRRRSRYRRGTRAVGSSVNPVERVHAVSDYKKR